MRASFARQWVGGLGVVLALCAVGCEQETEESVEEVDDAEAAIQVDDPVLVSGVCTTNLTAAQAAGVAQTENVLGMTPSQRVAAGVKKVSLSSLSADLRRAASVIATDPCEVEGETSCTSGTTDSGLKWWMCTDGISTCGYTEMGKLWCNG